MPQPGKTLLCLQLSAVITLFKATPTHIHTSVLQFSTWQSPNGLYHYPLWCDLSIVLTLLTSLLYLELFLEFLSTILCWYFNSSLGPCSSGGCPKLWAWVLSSFHFLSLFFISWTRGMMMTVEMTFRIVSLILLFSQIPELHVQQLSSQPQRVSTNTLPLGLNPNSKVIL